MDENETEPGELTNQPDERHPDSPHAGGDQLERLTDQIPIGPASWFFCDDHFGAWGSLPSRLQSALPNSAEDLLPLRYRRSLEAFHRRQQTPQR